MGKILCVLIIKNKPQKYEQFQLDVDTNDWVLLKTKYKNVSIKFNSKSGDLVNGVNNNLFVGFYLLVMELNLQK